MGEAIAGLCSRSFSPGERGDNLSQPKAGCSPITSNSGGIGTSFNLSYCNAGGCFSSLALKLAGKDIPEGGCLVGRAECPVKLAFESAGLSKRDTYRTICFSGFKFNRRIGNYDDALRAWHNEGWETAFSLAYARHGKKGIEKIYYLTTQEILRATKPL